RRGPCGPDGGGATSAAHLASARARLGTRAAVVDLGRRRLAFVRRATRGGFALKGKRRAFLAAIAAFGAVVVHEAASASSAASAPSCATSGLVVWLGLDTGGGAAGSTYVNVTFTNLSRHACTLRGYPGVSAVDLAGRQVGRAAARESGVAVRAVTLAAGSSAIAVLRIA